ncbi:hypothetical protein N7532_005610 [Penicillium argentinense]|uniref:SUN domain-containing protein n=1 Tax=Penicillium argentinense TaxID=1131581 RepID=A0A9W9K9Z8_9EURO|nr:uncharacterized protein N7532_005610 [Penicillium argentinense]KAJ5098609.1 hypothetical protein N7532_005610 [Penicillium argentinense]
MPRRTSPRRGGPSEGESHPPRQSQTLLEIGHNPILPPVAVGTSHNYGATGPTALPKRVEQEPIQSIRGVAQRIETGLDFSEQRTGLSKATTNFDLPALAPTTRRVKREPTPDQDQLLQSLREATQSPVRETQSDRTPTPPIQREVSTDSSPDMPPPARKNSIMSLITNSPMYPAPLRRLGNYMFPDEDNLDNTSMSSRFSSVDNASELSFELERGIHDDGLQRTRPSDHGTNLSKAPRRPSGVQIHSTIMEEDESGSEQAPESEYENLADQSWSAEARTVLPSRFQSEPPSEVSSNEPVPDLNRLVPEAQTNRARWLTQSPDILGNYASGFFKVFSDPASWAKTVFLFLLPLLLVFAYQVGLLNFDGSSLFGDNSPHPSNTSNAEFRALQGRVSQMDLHLSSLTAELKSAREERSYILGPTNVPMPNYPLQELTPRINFLSPAHGALIDPDQTSPTADYGHATAPLPDWNQLKGWWNMWKIFSPSGALPPPIKNPHSSLSALLPWDEAGDCWCSVGETQLSVFLGRGIVPEEVVIEHIPVAATLDPLSAPKVVEVWARFVIVEAENDFAPSASDSFSWRSPWGRGKNRRQSTDPPSSQEKGLGNFNLPGSKSLDEVILSALKLSNPWEGTDEYSNDSLLGPNYYRIGRMYYNIHDPDYIQTFPLATVIDVPTVRVDKVVFRVKENWGGDRTCIYRFKLHGHP